ncbi:MAG: response regulator transcription factor [Deinococcales bacterium]
MRVLLVEDEPEIATPLARALKAQGLEVVVCHDLEGGREAFLQSEPDLMLLDVRLHEHEDGGFILAREARAAGFMGSILFLTARDSLADRLEGLDGGGDDYVVKPFMLLEVLARVRALLRRSSEVKSTRLEFGRLSVDLARQEVLLDGIRVELSQREYALLERLMYHPSKIYSSEELLDLVWGDSASSVAVVKVTVYRLREKLGAEVIKSHKNGYQMGVA